MNKGVKYTFGGANQDIGKDKHPPHFYYEGQHIRIVATDGQTTGDVTNERGTEIVILLPKIDIVGVINPPVEAVNNVALVLEFETVNIPVLFNDVYAYDVTITITRQPEYGSVNILDDQTIDYISETDADVSVFDNFEYTIDDGTTSSSADVNIKIGQVVEEPEEEEDPVGDVPTVDDNFDGIHYHYMLSPCDTRYGAIHVKSAWQVVNFQIVHHVLGSGGIGKEGRIAYRTTDFESFSYTLGAEMGYNCPDTVIDDPREFWDGEDGGFGEPGIEL